jgi:hypothetical protein
MYRKSNNSRKVFGKYLSSLVVMIMLAVFIMPQKSHAFLSWDWIQAHFSVTAMAEKICNPTQVIFENIAHDQPQQSIIRFGYNYDTVRFLKIFYNIFGVSPDNAIRCLTTFGGTNFSWLGAVCTWVTGAPSTADCGNFILGYNYDPNNPDNYASVPGNGSLLSFYYKVDESVKGLGNPLDLNYFVYKSFEKTPFVGRALAQSNLYGAPLITDVYFAWVIVRNLAFGVFALLMLIVGIMMINRTRLNAQAVVTIQYALPKIIISVILIAFSYPIGAIIVTTVWYVRFALFSIVFSQGAHAVMGALGSLLSSYFSPTTFSINVGLLVVQIMLSVFILVGGSVLALILVLVLALIVVIQLFLCVIKQAIYYVKMLFEVVLAPVSFVYAAIPGNDDALMAWFKKMLAYALCVFVLSVMPMLVIFIALTISIGISTPAIEGLVGRAFAGGMLSSSMAMISVVAGALVTYVGLSMTLKLPAQIEEVITGVKKRK